MWGKSREGGKGKFRTIEGGKAMVEYSIEKIHTEHEGAGTGPTNETEVFQIFHIALQALILILDENVQETFCRIFFNLRF